MPLEYFSLNDRVENEAQQKEDQEFVRIYNDYEILSRAKKLVQEKK